MTCEKYNLYIAALALNEREGLSEISMAETQAHLRECAVCRKAYEETRRLAPHLRPDPAAARIVARPSDTTHIMAAIERDISRRRIRLLTKIAAVILMALGLGGLIAVGVRALRRQPVERPAPIAQDNEVGPAAPSSSDLSAIALAKEDAPAPEPEISALEQAFLAADTPGEAFKALQDAFDAAKAGEASHADDYPVIIALCAQLKEKWPITNQAANSIKLASRCWTELGEAEKAREVYIAYADYTGELEEREELKRGKGPEAARKTAEDITSNEILGEAQTLFARKEYVQSLSYCDVLLTRYPSHERGLTALKLIGEYSVKHRQYDEAIRVFKQIIEMGPESDAAEMARRSLPNALANAGRGEEAFQVWLECARRANTRREEANYMCLAGRVLAREDERAAVALLEKVIAEYPEQSDWVQSARRSIDRIRRRPFRKEVRDIENPVDILKQ